MHPLHALVSQWEFLQRDEGERDPGNDPSWLEDDGNNIYIVRTCLWPLKQSCLYIHTCTLHVVTTERELMNGLYGTH